MSTQPDEDGSRFEADAQESNPFEAPVMHDGGHNAAISGTNPLVHRNS